MGLKKPGKSKLINSLMEIRVKNDGARLYEGLVRDARRPEQVQREVLARILKNHENTHFGKFHRFKAIQTIEQFRAEVPVHDYESLRSWVDSQDLTGHPTMNPELPSFYAVSSGTSGQAKYIPVVKTTLKSHKRIANLFIYRLLVDRPDAFQGHILAIVSPALEGHRPESGSAYGSMSGHMYAGMPKLVRKKYVVPASLFGIQDVDLKYLLILRLALKYRDITYLTTANPSTLVRMQQLLNLHWDKLYQDLRQGTFFRFDELNSVQKRALVGRLGPRKKRAEELKAIVDAKGELQLADIFPRLQALGCWTSGSCRIFFDQIKDQLPAQTLVRDLGYLSSEFRGSTPVSLDSNAGVPTFRDYFFEFVERQAWDEGRPEFRLLHELQDHTQYYVFVTTDAGLYRYDMNDLIETDGYFEATPRIRFVQKGKALTRLAGERLYESQVVAALGEVEERLRLGSSFYVMVAFESEKRYQLYYEALPRFLTSALDQKAALARLVETELQRLNPDYALARQAGEIFPLEVLILETGTLENYKQACRHQGQREAQFKLLALQYKHDLPLALDGRVIESTLAEQIKDTIHRRLAEGARLVERRA